MEMNPRIMRFPRAPCWLCQRKAKYMCPACDCYSCCLGCCLKHKEVAGCSGDWKEGLLYDTDAPVDQRDVQFLTELEGKLESCALRVNSVLQPDKITSEVHGGRSAPRSLEEILAQQKVPRRLRDLQSALHEYDCTMLVNPQSQEHAENLSSASDGRLVLYVKMARLDVVADISDQILNYGLKYFAALAGNKGMDRQAPPFQVFYVPKLDFSLRTCVSVADEETDLGALLQVQGQLHIRLDMCGRLAPANGSLKEMLRRLLFVEYIKFVDVIPGPDFGGIQTDRIVSQISEAHPWASREEVAAIVKKLTRYISHKAAGCFVAGYENVAEWGTLRENKPEKKARL